MAKALLSFVDALGPRFYLEPTGPTKDAADIIAAVQRFEYSEDETKVDELTLILENKDLRWVDDKRFVEGLAFKVRWGYANDISDERLAVIVKAKPDFGTGFPTMVIKAFDLRRNMNRNGNPKSWGPVSSTAVARQIAARYNFDVDLEESNDARSAYRVQSAEVTDFQYLGSLAKKLNWDFYLEGGVLHFHHKRYESEPTLLFTYFTDSVGTMLHFTPDVDMSKAPVVGNTSASTQDGHASSKEGDNSTELGLYEINTKQNGQYIPSIKGPSQQQGPILDPSHESDKRVAAMHADALKRKIDMRAVTASASFIGAPRIRARTIVRIEGVGRVYSGNWRVASAKHVIQPSGHVYMTDCQLTRNGLNAGNKKSDDANNKHGSDTDKDVEPQFVDVNFVQGGRILPRIVRPGAR